MKLSAVFLLVFSMVALTSGLKYTVCRFRRMCFPVIKRCPRGWLEINGRCFLYVARPCTWANAEKICQALGANLASVHNVYEYHRIQVLIRVVGHNSRPTWIGGSDAQQERTWLWSDGRPMRYTNWCRGEPNNARGKQHCLLMNWSGGKCWDDYYCDYRWPSVCAKKLR